MKNKGPYTAIIFIKYFDKNKAMGQYYSELSLGQTCRLVIPESQEVVIYAQALWGRYIVTDLLRADEETVCIHFYG